MSDPSRLLQGEAEFERSLLRAWHRRQPSEAARRKTLAAIEAGAVVAVGGAGAVMAPKLAVASSSLLKWVGVATGVLATAGVIGYATQRGRLVETSQVSLTAPVASPGARSPVPESTVPQPPSPLGVVEVAGPAPVVAEAPAPAVTVAPGPVVAPAKVAAAAPPSSSLNDEVVAIDQARRALTAGNAAAALQLVDAYDARYPAGALAEESAEIRIEALFRTGKRALASDLATQFLAAHPGSLYARVIRALQAGAGAPPP
jgi:hypothetical protein